jgi:pimeloyl-ACP methyl ester carboxylesterase
MAALIGSLAFIVYCVSRPSNRPYLVTPQAFSHISGRVLKVTDESWSNRDGSRARGWLLRGAEGAPAVVLMHRYGADRSWLFNLGVKINETTNFTILWPDLRGHGLNPLVSWTSFGAREGTDVLAALDFLNNLKSENQKKLVRDGFGLYGVELGAYSALKAAQADDRIKVLVLDSIPSSPDELMKDSVTNCVGVDHRLLQYLARTAMKIYLMGAYENLRACDFASSLRDQRVLLLSGPDAGYLKESTASLNSCFKNRPNVEIRTDLPLSGLNLPSATGEQGEGYDRIVIEYFDRHLR